MSDIEKPSPLETPQLKLFIGFNHFRLNQGTVIIDFGKQVQYLELIPEQAEQMARMLLTHAKNARHGDSANPIRPRKFA